ncbi:MAG: hypothetical protein FWD84_07165 [Oscillospiraceae bacterium]|nr:hypothetical protein [Oscillospiraceae bacterium]
MFAYGMIMTPIFIKGTAKQWFSVFYIDEKGISSKLIFFKSKDSFIAWSEFTEIAFVSVPMGKGYYKEYIYFSKVPFTKKTYRYPLIGVEVDSTYALGHDENQFVLVYSNELLNEVLKHVDRDRIKGLDALNMKSSQDALSKGDRFQ